MFSLDRIFILQIVQQMNDCESKPGCQIYDINFKNDSRTTKNDFSAEIRSKLDIES